MKKIFMSILGLAFTLGVAFPVLAVELPDHKITVQEKKIGLRDALQGLLQGSTFKYKLSNNVTNDKVVTIDARDAKWSDVFKFLIAEGNLNYRVTSKKMILISP